MNAFESLGIAQKKLRQIAEHCEFFLAIAKNDRGIITLEERKKIFEFLTKNASDVDKEGHIRYQILKYFNEKQTAEVIDPNCFESYPKAIKMILKRRNLWKML
jgi:hypothetical protein